MPKQSATVEDELGTRWLILPGDPAWPACEVLLKRMSLIVLPIAIITGVDKYVLHPEIRQMTLERVQKAYDGTKSEGIKEAFVRGTRLLACLNMLEEEAKPAGYHLKATWNADITVDQPGRKRPDDA